MTNTGIKDYRLQLGSFDFVQTGIPAKLEDSYLNTGKSIDLSGSITNYDFSVTADPLSAAPDRFRIVFDGKKADLPTGITGINIYPNPVVNGTIGIQFTNMEKGIYNLRLYNNTGQVLFNRQINHGGNSMMYTIDAGKSLANGSYLLEFTKPDNRKTVKTLVILN